MNHKAAILASTALLVAAIIGVALSWNAQPVESFSIDSVYPDFFENGIKKFGVNNTGSSPLTLVKLYLIRSDGIVMNSTDLSFPTQPPSTLKTYEVSIAYAQAKATELYFIRVVSAAGSNATSKLVPLACDCDH